MVGLVATFGWIVLKIRSSFLWILPIKSRVRTGGLHFGDRRGWQERLLTEMRPFTVYRPFSTYFALQIVDQLGNVGVGPRQKIAGTRVISTRRLAVATSLAIAGGLRMLFRDTNYTANNFSNFTRCNHDEFLLCQRDNR